MILRTIHRRRRSQRSAQAGFTLIELMISLVLFSFAIAGVLSIAVTMVTGFREQRVSINTEQAARMSMEFVADAIRGAAPGVADATKIENVHTCWRGGFKLVNSQTAPDALTVVYPSGAVLTSLRTPYVPGAATPIVVTDGSQLAAGDSILVSNEAQGHMVKIASVAPATPAPAATITLVAHAACSGVSPDGVQAALPAPGGGYPPGSLVIRVERVTFYVTDVDNIPTLMMDPDAEGTGYTIGEPLAEGIEDFQIALAVDGTHGATNDITDVGAAANDDEWIHNRSGETTPTAASVIRGVKIWMIARATKPIAGGNYLRPAGGDRAISTTPDQFRRRILSSTVEIRNNESSL